MLGNGRGEKVRGNAPFKAANQLKTSAAMNPQALGPERAK